MRIFPIALIVIGALGVAKYLGWIPAGMYHLIGPVLLIALGVALFFRRPHRCGERAKSRAVWLSGIGGLMVPLLRASSR